MVSSDQTIEEIVSAQWGRVTGALYRRIGDLQLVEDALQDALLAALQKWPTDGVPDHPAAWLLRVAERKAIDHIRQQANFRQKRDQLALLAELERDDAMLRADEASPVPDETLGLIFTCCHPSLAAEAQVALTLKTVGGMSVIEIARAFLTTETTMAQRLVRAKRKIKAAGVPFAVPPPEHWGARLASVLSVIYFVFNEGYAAATGNLPVRHDLCTEAIRLGRILANLLPREAEVLGLVALMLLHDARSVARSDAEGNIIPLEFQDRSSWHGRKIIDGSGFLKSALQLGSIGPYQLQAVISACHDQAVSFAETDWTQIVAAYDQLYGINPSPVLLINRAVALSFAEDAASGMQALKELEVEPRLAAYQPYYAALADMYRRMGARDEACAAYTKAIELSANDAEKKFLSERRKNLLS